MQLIPRVDVVEAPEEIIYIFEIPGVETDRISIEIKNGSLLINAEVDTGPPDKNIKYLYQERPRQKQYVRLLSIPPEVEQDKAGANTKNGLLTIHFPKKKYRGRDSTTKINEQIPGEQERKKGRTKRQNSEH
jgi:HSP20 family protein